MKPTQAQSLELVRLCCRALDNKKAGDMRVLDVRVLSSITDYLVIGTATSEPHVRALRVELEKALDSVKTHIVGFETARESGWAVMDAFDVMVHIFTPEKRERYRLENLWRDARDVPLDDLLAPAKRPGRKKTRPGRTAADNRKKRSK